MRKFKSRIKPPLFLQKLYYGFLNIFVDDTPKIKSYEQEDVYFYTLKNLKIEKEANINVLKPTVSNVNDYGLAKSIEDKCKKIPLNLNVVKVNHYMEIFADSIRWFARKLKLTSALRKYPVRIYPGTVNFEDVEIPDSSMNKLNERELHIAKKLRVTEEIVGMEPYVKKAKNERLVEVPIRKASIPRSEFSKTQMEIFRDKLAAQGQTKKININLLNIYDRFPIGIFGSIKQDDKSSDLICYFNKQNIRVADDDIYYLVIGARKDNETLIKVLVKPDELISA